MDLQELRRSVLAEIDKYVYVYPDGMIGEPLGAAKIRTHLEEMRAALTNPYWAEITLRDTVEQINATNPPVRRCAVVADDGKGTLLAFDPIADRFLLAGWRANALESYGVDGDAVGCFMAR